MTSRPVRQGDVEDDPDEVVRRARVEHRPVATWCLFSGGNDSAVLAHRCREQYEALVWIDTGTAFRVMVLGQVPHGFPGPGAHGRAYNRLKERQLMELLRESKMGHPRSARVLFLSGIRRPESRRRARREPVNRLARTSAVFANPLIAWTGDEMRRYRRDHRMPESPAAALLCRSGECNCGAFAKASEERAMLQALYPEFFAGIEALEREAEAAGVRWCRWGGYDVHGNRAGEASSELPGPLCESCEARQRPAARARRAGAPRALSSPSPRDVLGTSRAVSRKSATIVDVSGGFRQCGRGDIHMSVGDCP